MFYEIPSDMSLPDRFCVGAVLFWLSCSNLIRILCLSVATISRWLDRYSMQEIGIKSRGTSNYKSARTQPVFGFHTSKPHPKPQCHYFPVDSLFQINLTINIKFVWYWPLLLGIILLVRYKVIFYVYLVCMCIEVLMIQ